MTSQCSSNNCGAWAMKMQQTGHYLELGHLSISGKNVDRHGGGRAPFCALTILLLVVILGLKP